MPRGLATLLATKHAAAARVVLPLSVAGGFAYTLAIGVAGGPVTPNPTISLGTLTLASADATSWIYALSRYGAFQYLGRPWDRMQDERAACCTS